MDKLLTANAAGPVRERLTVSRMLFVRTYRLAERSPAISAILLTSRRLVDQIDFLEPS